MDGQTDDNRSIDAYNIAVARQKRKVVAAALT